MKLVRIVRLKELIELSSMVFCLIFMQCSVQEILHPEIRRLKTGDLCYLMTARTHNALNNWCDPGWVGVGVGGCWGGQGTRELD